MSVPPRLEVGEATERTIDGEQVVLVGSAPHGLPVILSIADWESLKRWKLCRLITFGGRVRGSDGQSRSRPHVVRFLNPRFGRNFEVRYRNGNAMDLRPANVAFVPRGLLKQARKEVTHPAPSGATVTLSDGRKRSMRKRTKPPAAERIKTIIAT